MKTRNLFAGAVLGALAVGIWLGGFWKGLGWGGSGTGLGVQTSGESVDLDQTHVRAPAGSSTPAGSSSRPALPAPAEDMITVAIYGNEYRLVQNDDPHSGPVTTLSELGKLAQHLTGTPEGIRVRVLKGKSAQEGARADLLKTLEENGVKREEIQERAEFID